MASISDTLNSIIMLMFLPLIFKLLNQVQGLFSGSGINLGNLFSTQQQLSQQEQENLRIHRETTQYAEQYQTATDEIQKTKSLINFLETQLNWAYSHRSEAFGGEKAIKGFEDALQKAKVKLWSLQHPQYKIATPSYVVGSIPKGIYKFAIEGNGITISWNPNEINIDADALKSKFGYDEYSQGLSFASLGHPEIYGNYIHLLTKNRNEVLEAIQ